MLIANLEVVILPILGVAFAFVFLPYLMSAVSGWASLAHHYRFRHPFPGPRIHACSLRFGNSLKSNYTLIVTLGANAEGLYLAVFPLFRLGHPKLFIPWTDIQAGHKNGLIWTWLVFTFEKVPGVVMWMTEDEAKQIAKFANRSWAGVN